MAQEEYKYFISFISSNKLFQNLEITRNKFIEGIDDIREIENEIKNDIGVDISILYYRMI